MSAPVTPRVQKVVAVETPASLRKRFDANSSLIDEDDATYYLSESESDGNSDESTYEGDADFKENIQDYVIVEKDEHVALADEAPAAAAPSTFYEFLVRNEIPRKMFHSFHGFTTLYLYCQGVQQEQLVAPLWTLFFLLLLNDIVRLQFPAVNKFLVSRLGFVIRESEINSWNGIVFYLAGLALVFTFASKDICIMSVLLLSWADTAASTFGRQFGKYTPKIAKGKSLAGSLASAFTGLVVCYLVYGYFVPQYAHFNREGEIFWTPESSHLSIHAYALVCAFSASISEAIDIAGIDDNFTIPVLSSLLLSGAVWAFHK